MPQLHVLACPSCGASLSIEPRDATVECQFCGNTIVVPDELRAPDAPPAPAPLPPPGAIVPVPSPDVARLAQLGQLVRAGQKLEAVRLYREITGAGLKEAVEAVDAMAAGRPVQIGPMSAMNLGAPPAGPRMPDMAQVAAAQPPSPGRSIGCSLLMSAVIGLFTLGIVAAFAVPGLAALFGLGAWGIFGQASGTAEPGAPLIVGPRATATANAYARVVLSFGGEGTGPGRFEDARHVAVGPDGNIYVGEWSDEAPIQVFDAQGRFLTQIGLAQGDGILTSMVVDRQGTLYTVRGSNLYRYEAESGQDLGIVEYGEGWGFGDLALMADGGLVASWYKNRDDIVVFDPQGKVRRTVSPAISGVTGDLEPSTQVAVDGRGNIYALGRTIASVFHFGPDGSYADRFGGKGNGPGQFTAPGDIAVDNEGRIFITDFDGVLMFDADGTYRRTFDVPGAGFIYGLAFDDQNALYAVDGKKVYKLVLED